MALLAYGGALRSVPYLSRACIAAELAFSSPHRRRFGCGAGASWGSLISIVLLTYPEMGSLPAIEILIPHTAIMPGGYMTFCGEDLTEIRPNLVLRQGLSYGPQDRNGLSPMIMGGNPELRPESGR